MTRTTLKNLAALGASLLVACSPPQPEPENSILQQALGGDASGFISAVQPREFQFPEDHGAHNGFRNEWWYITGNLVTDTGAQYGFQVTFFRIQLSPGLPDAIESTHNPQDQANQRSQWSTNHVWMVHTAVTDVDNATHNAVERFGREALGLAGIESSPFRIWVGNWQLAGQGQELPWKLTLDAGHFAMDFTFTQHRPVTLQGKDGLSSKSGSAGNNSYYYSISRLDTKGSLRLGQTTVNVSGPSWLDREWSSSALAANQVGWDWFSLQFDDGSDLMFYHLRNPGHKTDSNSAGSYLSHSGIKTNLNNENVTVAPKRWWTSQDGVKYPVDWELEIKPLGRKLLVQAVLDDQEMNLSVRYWEGLVVVSGRFRTSGRRLLGNDRISMTW